MSAKFYSVIGALLLGVVASAQSAPATTAPKVAILELDMGRGLKDNAIAKEDFKRLGADVILVQPTSGEKPSNLVALFSCADIDAACLTQISSSLKVRFVLYGSLDQAGANEKFSVSLFDAEVGKILASEQVTFSFESRGAEMQKAIRKTVSVKGTESIRKAEKLEPIKAPKTPAKGLWKFAAPVVFGSGAAIFGAQAQQFNKAASGGADTAFDLTDVDGSITLKERDRVFQRALVSDVFLVATIGSATWALLSYKKHGKKSVEQTASNP